MHWMHRPCICAPITTKKPSAVCVCTVKISQKNTGIWDEWPFWLPGGTGMWPPRCCRQRNSCSRKQAHPRSRWTHKAICRHSMNDPATRSADQRSMRNTCCMFRCANTWESRGHADPDRIRFPAPAAGPAAVGSFVLPRTAGHLPHPKEAGPFFRAAYLQPQTGASRTAVL